MIIKNGRIHGQKGTIPYEAEDGEDMLFLYDPSFDLMLYDYGLKIDNISTYRTFVKLERKDVTDVKR